MGIEIREITTLVELEEMQKVEHAIWGDMPTPIHQTYTAYYNGGVMIGAFLDGRMIGFQYSFPGFNGKNPYLVSHTLGVLPEYRKLGLGGKIKLKQAEVAGNKGYDMMIWTFDPLESVNAYLNLHKLGGVVTTYKENHYGELDDGLNSGLATDRFQVEWYFRKEQERKAIVFETSRVILEMDEDEKPKRSSVDFQKDGKSWFVAIPDNIQEIKQRDIDLAIEWRMATRDIFKMLIANGYQGRDVIRGNGVSYYCFCSS
ncbi:GNAT family N-acetyltransferase [Paucisalibacillus sp. EB02]|uniref:GNAT family N-acetyltransferase n=1 Tax=Paucisalibacillus sp. EB02 TaxID=1347087 RepID=UPI0004BB068F|nr:GNAT family N-acetyltransferase [Paucisalibacillus sp. EB02]